MSASEEFKKEREAVEARISADQPLTVKGTVEFEIRYEKEQLQVNVKGSPEIELVAAWQTMGMLDGIIKFSQKPENAKSFTMKEKQDFRTAKSLLKKIVVNKGMETFERMVTAANAPLMAEANSKQKEGQ